MQDRAGKVPRRVFEPLLGWLEAEQERWAFWTPVLLGVGIGTYFSLHHEPHALTAVAALCVAVAVYFMAPRHALLALVTGALVLVTFGFALAKLRVEWVRAPVLTKQMRAVEVRGYIEFIEPRPQRGQRLTLRVSALADLAPRAHPRRVRITTKKVAPALKAGDAVRVRATLLPPPDPALPGGYDVARKYWFHGLGGVGYAFSQPELEAHAPPPPIDLRWWAAVERLRQAIGQRITAVLPGQPGAIANALITGERGGISDATNDAFRDSGLLHMLSISGLHMAVMAGSVFYLVRLLLAAVPMLALRYPIKKWAAAAAMLGALCYLLVSGSSFPTVRATIMVSIMFTAVLLDRPALALRNVVLAALVILVLFPESLLDVGFQMSFAAVVALISAYEFIRTRDGWSFFSRGPVAKLFFFFAGIVVSTLIASAAVAPFAAYHFHKSQQFAVLANLIAMPVCNLIVMPAALMTLITLPLGLEGPALWVMGWGIEAMLWTARTVAALPGAVLRIPAMPVAAFMLMVAGGLWLTLWQTRWRLAGLALVAAGIAIAPLQRLPDVLVGRDGKLVAVRGLDGSLIRIGQGRTSFELSRWQEHGGETEGRRHMDTQRVVCDGLGCRTRIKGLTLAVARHPAAFRDDCRRASIVVSKIVSPKSCTAPKAVVDFFAVRRQGTHALYIEEDGAVRIETVGDARGNRPWSMPYQRGAR